MTRLCLSLQGAIRVVRKAIFDEILCCQNCDSSTVHSVHPPSNRPHSHSCNQPRGPSMQNADMFVYLGAMPFFPVVSPRATCPPKNDDDPPLMIHINDKEMILLADNEDFGVDWTRSLSRKERSSSKPRDTVARYTPGAVVIYVGEFT